MLSSVKSQAVNAARAESVELNLDPNRIHDIATTDSLADSRKCMSG